MQRIAFFLIILGILAVPANFIFADSIHYNKDQLAGGLTSSAFGGDFQVILPPGYTKNADLYIFPGAPQELPAGLKLVSQIFDYYFLSDEITDSSVFKLILKYQSESAESKHPYVWNFKTKKWDVIPSTADSLNKTISAEVTGRKGQIAVFETSEYSVSGPVINYPDGQFSIKLPSQPLGQDINTSVKSFYHLDYPSQKTRVSDIYQFDIKSDAGSLDLKKAVEITIKYSKNDNFNKACYHWDNNKNNWVKLPSTVDFYNHSVTAKTHLPFSRVTLFNEPGQHVGEASWYSWKNGDFAASRDYAKGTKLKITNITSISKNFGKSVIVTVNDYGPELATGRLIDLDKYAYRKIGYLSGGVMPVLIEKVK